MRPQVRELYDVFVIGSADPTPAAEMHLASMLAERHRAPVAAVAQALANKNLRAGHALPRPSAEAISAQLQTLGALTAIRPVEMELPAPVRRPARSDNRTLSGPPPSADPFNAPTIRTPGLRPLTTVRDPHGPPTPARDPFTGGSATPVSSPALRPLTAAARDPFLPPVVATPVSSPAIMPRPAADPFAGPGAEAEAPLVLERPTVTKPPPPRAVEPDIAPALAPGEPAVSGRLSGFRENPTRRAFFGLFVALAIGLLPAAYHALSLGTGEVRRLRAEQEQLSLKAGTEENLQRFDALEDQVSQSRTRAMRNTLLVWVVVSGVVLALWFRIT